MRASLLPLLLLFAFACEESADPTPLADAMCSPLTQADCGASDLGVERPDEGPSLDAAPALDEGLAPDVVEVDEGVTPDAAPQPDEGTEPDTAAMDEGLTPDVMTQDEGLEPDAASPDEGIEPDAVAPDEGLELDMAPPLDEGLEPDMAPLPDEGFEPDAAQGLQVVEDHEYAALYGWIVAAQPSEARVTGLVELGAWIISLRAEAEDPFDEPALIASLDGHFARYPMNSTLLRDPTARAALYDALDEALEGAALVYLHCAGGARAGAAWGLYLGERRGVPLEEAVAQGIAAGGGGFEDLMREVLEGL